MQMMRTAINTSTASNELDKSGRILQLKKNRDDETSQLASDTTGILGVGDPDPVRFLTPAFKDLRMLQVKSGPQMYGTLGLFPEQQHRYKGTAIFRDGGVRALDRAGSATFTNNIVRTGPPPDSYVRGADTILVQKRIAHTFNPAIDRVGYTVEVREVPKDYVLQPDERYDGDFRPHNALGLGEDFTSPYPINDKGQRLYNDDPKTEAGWSGQVYTIEYNAETIPVITSIAPDFYQLPVIQPLNLVLIYGHQLSHGLFVMIGPYRAPVSSTAEGFLSFFLGLDVQPGVYDVIVVGDDGQYDMVPLAFTVLAPVE